MAEKRRAPMSLLHTPHGGNTVPVREYTNPAYVEKDGPQPGRKMSLPLPDYDTLFPQKRHGVQGQTRWDHIIAEVNQKHRDFAEMSVDGPEEDEPSVGSSLPQESPAMRLYQTQPQQPKPMSSKKTAAPALPKSVTPPDPNTVVYSSQTQSQNAAHQSLMRPNLPAVAGPVNTSRESLSSMSRDGPRRVLHSSPAATPAARPTSQMDLDTPAPDDHRVALNKDVPTAKPRQRAGGKEPVKQEDSAPSPVVSHKHMNRDIHTLSSSNMSSIETRGRKGEENFEFDPFPSIDLLSKDPWNQELDDIFTVSAQKEQKVEDQGMTPDDLDKIFSQEKPTDLFADFNGSDLGKRSEYMKKDEDSKQLSPAFQRRNSPRQKASLPSKPQRVNMTSKSRQEPAHEEETATANHVVSARSARKETVTPKTDAKTQSQFYGEDQFGAEPFTSTVNFSEPLHVVMEEVEPASQAGGLSGGKAPLRAWVSPTDVQPVSTPNSNGGGLALTPRRPHPVRPMSSESQHPISSPAIKEIKVRDRTPGKVQVADPVESGPFTQLTQEELITLVVRQQADLSRKDSKIVELEEYIDNLLVRVIDEQPGILHSLNAGKPV